jgi:hypothetical protein
MRKQRFLLLSIVFLFAACQKNGAPADDSRSVTVVSLNRSCAADDVLKAQLDADPGLQLRMNQIEDFTKKVIAHGELLRTTTTAMVVPVVVHVLYNKQVENISDAQIQSQIDVLNEDFNLNNKDAFGVPAIFSSLKSNVAIRFQLVKTVRKYTAVTSWPANDAMKYSEKGGSDVIDPAHKLNMWVCNLGSGLLGYAQFPGGNSKTDGIVCGYFCFGRTGNLERRFDRGRTATHEVGHWMNLRHIWGDVRCGNDMVGDTPQATTYNFGCPTFPKYNTCVKREVEMTMNYMDYTDDACMFMFTNGQADRMKAIFLNGGPRGAFFQ